MQSNIRSIRFPVHFVIGLLTMAFVMGCDRGKPFDPDAAGLAAGRRARAFYEMVVDGKLPESTKYFSQDVAAQYADDPLQEPLLKKRQNNQFNNITPRLDHVDWRTQTVWFRVELRESKPRVKGGPIGLAIRETRLDRWIFENGEWHYDGSKPKP